MTINAGNKRSFILIVTLILILCSIIFLINRVSLFDCEDVVLQQKASPNGLQIVTVFSRDCGATTNIATSVNIQHSYEKFDLKRGKIILTVENSPPISVDWDRDSYVILTYPPIETFIKRIPGKMLQCFIANYNEVLIDICGR